MSAMTRVGWIGAGRMGFEMAKRLAMAPVVPATCARPRSQDGPDFTRVGTQRRSPDDTGFPRARERQLDLTVWNRTRAKAEPLARYGVKIANALPELADCDV